ncbi:MAG TPA: hypothetical protein VFO85_10755, partial [Vicinamibacteria bacterium]|nr:hypothetical protein [Vicinamibacteria bacterium]
MSQPPPPGPDGKAPTRRLSIDDLGLAAAPDAAAAESANAFLYAWFQLFKTAQIHSIDNQALGRPVQQFAGLVGRTIAR